MIRVVRGNPTPEELAAALAVVQARAAAAAAEGEPRGSVGGASGAAPAAWSDPARTVPRGLPTTPGPNAWRMSYRQL
ncbi:acyl-CoA carboxylase epsilon subunit [Streptomyces sp. 4N509B]|uniref:acyl-CoA carboxylase epsilon subunit n=1 Tax=Streptomyces sp. 4N509B TaxID=3457413 RepID=UPI003FD64168